MVWIIRTEYYIGIFLSSAAVNKIKKKTRLHEIACEDYKEAIEMLKNMEEKEKIKIPWENFMPNRLYQIKSKKCYVVVYNKNQVGFSKTNEINIFCEKSGINLKFFKVRCNVEYMTAVSMVMNLCADVGKDQILDRSNPVANKLYTRIK